MLARVQNIDWARLLISVIMAAVALSIGVGAQHWFAAAYTGAAASWVAINAAGFVDQQRRPRWAYVPATLDILGITWLVSATNVFSPFVVGYTGIIAISAMNQRVRQGEYAAVVSFLVFVLLLAARIFWPTGLAGWTEASAPGVALALLAALFVGMTNLMTLLTVRSLVNAEQQTRAEMEAAHAALASDLAIARRLQQSLLPARAPALLGAQVHSRYVSLEAVGGDVLAYLSDDEDALGVLVADASGHGVSAALVASMTKVALQRMKDRMHEPAQVLSGINASLLGKTNFAFVTAAYAVLDCKSRNLRYAIAGAPPPFLLRPGQPAQDLPGKGPLIGVLPSPGYVECSIELQKGDRVALFTDGILECRNTRGDTIDIEQVTNLLSGVAGAGSEESPELIMNNLQAYVGERGFEDDVTLALITV